MLNNPYLNHLNQLIENYSSILIDNTLNIDTVWNIIKKLDHSQIMDGLIGCLNAENTNNNIIDSIIGLHNVDTPIPPQILSHFIFHQPPPYITLRLLLLYLIIGYCIPLAAGITKDLLAYPHFRSMLEELWEIAIFEIHPYQIGPTNQGTLHSISVLRMLNRVNNLHTLDLTGIGHNSRTVNIAEGVILSSACALHDIWKASINSGNHNVNGSNFIRNSAELVNQFSANNQNEFNNFKEAIAKVTLVHSGSYNFNLIGNLSINNINCRVKEISAIFRLSDVLDITCKRVSTIYKEINLNSLPPEKQAALLAREKINKVCFDLNNNLIILRCSAVDQNVHDTVNYENALLDNSNKVTLSTGAVNISNKSCNAGVVLDNINIPRVLRAI